MKEIINSNKQFLFIVLTIGILISLTTIVFASSPTIIDQNDLGFGGNNNFENLTDQQNNNAIGNNTNNTANTVNNITNNTTNNTNTNNVSNNTSNRANTNSNKLPQTGIEDYSIGIMIIICIASAIYAYKKVRDYNNI